MSQYRTGTVSVTNGSPIVSGSGTAWIENVSIGDAFKIESENVVYSVASVDSDNQITLSTNYVGVTASGLTYQIVVDFTPNLELPEIWAGDIDWPYHLTQGLRRIDTLFAGLVNTTKETCRVATTANLDCTYSDTALTLTANAVGAISIDGVSLAANDRVLVKNQTTATQNGIYFVSVVGTESTYYVLTRATDFDDKSEIVAGIVVYVTEGTANADTGWMLTTDNPITLDTTSLTFQIFAKAGTSEAPMTTATNPSTNTACTTAIVDNYSGVVITTTTTGNSQTMQNPTDIRAGKIFTVVNNDSSTHSIPIVANSVTFTITAGEAQSFIWDGAQWGPTDMGITAIPVTVSQGGTGLATLTDHGILLGSGTGAVTPMSVGTDGQLVKGVSASDPIWSTTTLTDGTNTFNLTNGTASLDIAAGATLNIDKSLTVDGQATTITGSGQANTITLNESITIGDGYSGTLTYSAASKTLTVEGTSVVNQDLTTDASPQFTGIELGNASDTTITRVSAGQLAVEGVNILMNGGALGTPASGDLQNCTAATDSAKGVVELATNAEVVAGADTSRAITPAGLAAKIGVYDIHEVSEFPDDYTAAGLALLDDTNAEAQRTTLGLGTMSTQAANNVNISGGAITGITDLAIADGGTGASTASTARTALGVAIGVDVMAYEAWPIHEVEELCSVD